MSRRALNGFSCSQGSRCLIWFRQFEFGASALPGSRGRLQNGFTRLHFYCKFPALRGKEDLLASSTAASGINDTSPKGGVHGAARSLRGQRQVIPAPWSSRGGIPSAVARGASLRAAPPGRTLPNPPCKLL